MSRRTLARAILIGTGLYDGLLGLIFLVAAPAVFRLVDIPTPDHWGYVHFSAALLMIFALMFFTIATQPEKYRNLIVFGMLLKAAYVGVVSYHWVAGYVPMAFKVFVLLDVAWFFALLWTFLVIRPNPDTTQTV